jgi:ribosomal protein L11 methyltransferase
VQYPALEVSGGIDSDFLLALVDDFNPSAVDTHDSVVTIFFPDAARRDSAKDVIAAAHPGVAVRARDVDDEDWARRSQENLAAITVGRITVAPPWHAADPNPESRVPSPLTIVIAPSMGFGTGHHATTRLCLRALLDLDLRDTSVVDAGTGSGILAIAARLLGAVDVLGVDDDADAIAAARENLARNPNVDRVSFEVGDLRTLPLPRVDVIAANLTGVLLIRSAAVLCQAIKPGGRLVVSGIQSHERDEVVDAFSNVRIVWEQSEDEWVAVVFKSEPGTKDV